jgi:hypothetical protein
VLNDQFGKLEVPRALDILAERRPVIEVVGVTDYLVTDTFRCAAAAWEGGAGESIKCLFANVELRLQVGTQRGRFLNLHLLCAADQVDELDRFLSNLEFSFDGRPYRADRQSLLALGRAYTGNSSLDDAAALREGVNQFKVSFEALRDRLTRDQWAMSNCLVAAAGGMGDGTSGVRDARGGSEALRQEIERFAHLLFDSNPKQREFWLGEGSLSSDEIVARYGCLKLCLHGSDAHTADDLGSPDQDRFTWLKGDPSFEALYQACIEPRTRAHIGRDRPADADAHGRIADVIVDSSTWFVQRSVPLNPRLVAIIGPRGSGKTALADLIAAGAGSDVPFENPASFISRAGPLMEDTIAAVSWTQGDITTRDCGPRGISPEESAYPLRYLSQQFVERLCAADGVSDELLAEVERVVFNSWPVEERLGTTDFQSLLAARLEAAKTQEDHHAAAILDLSVNIADQRILKESLPARRRDREALTKRLLKLQQEAKELTKKADQKRAIRLAAVAAALDRRERDAQAASRECQALEALRREVETARGSDFPRQLATMRSKYESAGFDDEAWRAFSLTFVGDVDTLIATRATNAESARQKIVGGLPTEEDARAAIDNLSEDELLTQTVSALRVEGDRLQRLVGIDRSRTERLRVITSESSKVSAALAEVDAEIVAAQQADGRLNELGDERLSHYTAYFDALLEEESELRALYAPLDRILSESSESVRRLRFSVRRVVDIARWTDAGEALLDLRKDGAFRGRGMLRQIATSELLEAWQSGNGHVAAAAVRAFSVQHSGDLRAQSRVDSADLDEYRQWEKDVARWLYSAQHVGLTYSLEYEGIDIRRLSPGSRGIVLLLLYLAVDEEETIPLIIDQPEENLDPESVYAELVSLFQRASSRRQVIMVTHNANLVVNTDVDQVIVAHSETIETEALPQLRYSSGGLENPGIRTAVCQVLEGGETAFRERARRLRLDL